MKITDPHNIMRKNWNGKTSFIDVLLAMIGMVPLIFLPHSSFVYFYNNYVWYSLFFIVIGCMFFCKFLPKRLQKEFTVWYYISMPIALMTFSVWIVPPILHLFYYDKHEQCLTATLSHKRFMSRSDTASIYFYLEPSQNTPRELLSLDKISGISRDEYNALPAIYSKINICGDISKVGFSYSYIDASE